MVGHLFHWHPVYVSANRLKQYSKFRYVSIDAILPELLFPNSNEWDKIHLVTRSDDFGFVTLGPSNKEIPSTGKPLCMDDLKRYYASGIDVRDIGRWMFRHKVTYSGFLPANLPKSEMTYDVSLLDDFLPE